MSLSDDVLALMPLHKGHVQFESGHHGDEWLQLELLFLKPQAMNGLCASLAARVADYNVEGVCGPFTEGAFVALQVATRLNVEFSYAVRAESGRDSLFPIDYSIPGALRARVRGKRIAIVNDVINAGSAVRATFSNLVACGAQPIVIAALLIRGDCFPPFASEHRVALESLAVSPSNLWEPSKCPLCSAGVPLERLADF